MRLPIILSLLCLSFCVQAQTVTGSWYGIAEAVSKGPNTNSYLMELVIKQRGTEVEGVFGYYFRSGYQSYYVYGTYNPQTRVVNIKNLPLAFYKNRDIDGIECPMDFSAVLFTSKVKSTLNGSFKSHEKYRYTCPELIFNSSLDINEKNQDSILKSSTVNIKKYWKPRDEELVINPNNVTTVTAMAERMTMEAIKDSIAELKKTATRTPAAAKDTVAGMAGVQVAGLINNDSVTFKTAELARKQDLEKLVVSFEKRKTILSSEAEIESDSVRISFYDNGDIDGDTITIFINKIPVLIHQPLAEKALNMYLSMDSVNGATEISMYAENLGKYPPNTALMVITDGEKRKEIFLSSSLTQNSAVILKRKKKQ